MPVEVITCGERRRAWTPEQPRLPAPGPALALLRVPAPHPATAAAARLDGLAGGLIEIVLPGGVSVRVDAQVDAQALRRVLGALEGR